ncbi:hypothetical protein ALON55S_07367 [Alishewanella longhuensis]
MARSKLQRVELELMRPINLPGPTGESNTLTLDPRGILALLRDDSSSFSHWLLSIITALAAGNAVITAVENNLHHHHIPAKILDLSRQQEEQIEACVDLKTYNLEPQNYL